MIEFTADSIRVGKHDLGYNESHGGFYARITITDKLDVNSKSGTRIF